MRTILLTTFVVLAIAAAPVSAQGPNDAARMSAQQEAMKAFDMLEGVWRGKASTLTGDGGWHNFVQTERVGSMLDGTIKVIEGRGYEADGTVSFNAFAVISYDPDRRTYAMRSYTGGRGGDFPIVPTPTGFTWEIQAGPNMRISYEAVVKDGTWTETGTRIPKEGEPVKFITLTVNRVGDTDWPAAGAVTPNYPVPGR